MASETAYTWDETERQFRDKFGRFVARKEVRDSLDRYLDVLQDEAGAVTQKLVDQDITIDKWQLQMEDIIKRGHVTATAIAKGGHKQARPRDWGEAGAAIRGEYGYLARFAKQLEDGRPVNAGTVARARMYAIAPTGTYERLLRRDDMRAGFDLEMRLLHSEESCPQCIYYNSLGWQPVGTLPDIGTQSQCLSRCRCTFDRKRSPEARKRRGLSMSTETPDNCQRRSRIAALRDGVDAAPVRLYQSGMRPSYDERLRYSVGELPSSDEAAIALINSRFQGGHDLTKEEVWIHYIEAANSNFINDRFMFLDGSTLRNVASGGADGIAFMNSHRTGGLSSPSELPFGRTFSGRYEEHEQPDGSTFKRALLGLYMLKGTYPNGTGGPSTDDLHKSIQAGTLTDVSIGLGAGGERLCDVCARSLESSDCNHVPGTHRNMNPDQIEAQKSRGIKGGEASYTVTNAQTLEVSAVYKGAVPGAGFRKAMTLGRSKAFGNYAAEILSAYGSLMDEGDKALFSVKSPVPKEKGSKMKLFDWLKFGTDAGIVDSPDGVDLSTLAGVSAATVNRGAQSPPVAPAAPAPADAERLAALDAREAKIKADEREVKRERFEVQADRFVIELEAASKIVPAEKEGVKLSYVLAAMDDEERPLTVGGKAVSRLSTLQKNYTDRAPHKLTTEETGDTVLPAGEEVPGDPDKPTAARLAALLKGSKLGQQVIDELKKS